MEELCSDAYFGNQQDVVVFLLGDQCQNFVEIIQRS